MKILVADVLEKHALEELRHLGLEVLYEPEIGADGIPKKVPGVGILVVRATEVTAAAIEAAPELNLIIRAGVGAANIDTAAASARGVYVATCPGKNAAAVAELVMGFACALDRRIADGAAQLRAGRWERAELSRADGLLGQTIGLAGFGSVAREVASRARSFGMHVLALGRSLTTARAAEHGVLAVKNLEELASRSTIFSVHLPLNERTRGVISRQVIDALPERAIFINTARADLVDHAALRDAVEKKHLRVALDVFPDEPHAGSASYASDLFDVPGGLVYGMPHVGAHTRQAEHAIAVEVVRIVRSFLRTGEVPNCVNIATTSPARYQLVVRSLDKVGVLANVLGVLKRHGLNVEELSSTIFDGAHAACTKMRVTGRPSESCVQEIKAFSEILHVDVVALPNLA